MLEARLRMFSVLVILAFLPVIAGMVYSGQVLRGSVGPTVLAVGDGQVAVALPGEFLLLDLAGNLLRQVDNRDAGLREPLSAIAFLDRNTLLVAGDTGSTVMACTLQETASCLPWTPVDGPAPVAPLSFLLTPDALWISESNAHRVHLFDRAGRVHDTSLNDSGDRRTLEFFSEVVRRHGGIDQVSRLDGLLYPDGLALVGDMLYVANTGKQEILGYPLQVGVPGRPQVFASGLAPQNAGNYRYPLQLAAVADGTLWATVSDLRYTRSTLLHFGLDGRVDINVDLPGSMNPRALRALDDDRVLVADSAVTGLWRVARDGSVSVFGDPALRQCLEDWQERRERFALYYRLSQVVLVLLVLATMVLALLDRRRRLQGAVPVVVTEIERGSRGREAGARRERAGVMLVLAVVFLFMAGTFAYIGLSEGTAWRIGLGGGLIMALVATWWWRSPSK